MASNFGSFDQSPLGAFIESPLGVRGRDDDLTVTDLINIGGYAVDPGPSVSRYTGSGKVWSKMGGGLAGVTATTSPQVNGILSLSGKNYAYGQFRKVSGAPADYFAQWIGGSWTEPATINSFVTSGDSLGSIVLCGLFTSINAVPGYNGGAAFDGTTWTALGIGPGAAASNWATKIDPNSGLIYLGRTGGAPFTNDAVRVFNGATWGNLGTGLDGICYALEVYGTDVWAGGALIDNVPIIPVAGSHAFYNGSSWTINPGGVATGATGSQAYAFTVWNGLLIMAGAFTAIGGTPVNRVAAWNGASWSALAGGFSAGVASTLTVWNGLLVIGGNNLVRSGVSSDVWIWDGATWTAIEGSPGSAIICNGLGVFQ